MSMLDDLVAEMRRRGWPEPDRGYGHTRLWGDMWISLFGECRIFCSNQTFRTSWTSVENAADELDRMRAELKPGEIPCLDSARSRDPAAAAIEDVLALVREPDAVSLLDCTAEFRSTKYRWGNCSRPNLVIYTTSGGNIDGWLGGVRRKVERLHAMLSDPTARAYYGLEKLSNRDLSLGQSTCVQPTARSNCQNERPSYNNVADIAAHATPESAASRNDAREASIRHGHLLPWSNTAFLLRRLDDARVQAVRVARSAAAGASTIPSIDTAAWNAERSQQSRANQHDWIGALRKPFVPTM